MNVTVTSSSEDDGSSLTFLAHFNDSSSWNINTSNGDYAKGSGIATVLGAPTWGTGIFHGSIPEDKAFHATDGSKKVTFSTINNVEYANPTSGGITIGMWCKFQGENPSGKSFIIHSSDWSDYLTLSYNSTETNKWVATLSDSGTRLDVAGTNATSFVNEWMYIAVTINFDSQELTLYQYDANGNSVAGSPRVRDITSTGFDVRDGVMQLNYQLDAGGVLIDEFSVSNASLTSGQMQERVDLMVAGREL